MRRTVTILLLVVSGIAAIAQEPAKSDLQQRAETEDTQGNIANARSLFIRAYESYAGQGKMRQAVECGVRATALYYKENFYNEAFDLLRRIDQNIEGSQGSATSKSALHYLTTRERFQMYMKMRRGANAQDQLNIMDRHAYASGDEGLKNDVLYNKTIYYYTFGQNEKGNATFRTMADKLTADKEYDKVDEVYRTLIENGRRSNSANLVAQSYDSYIAWKDSAAALRHADEVSVLNQQIADYGASIAEKDDALARRQGVIAGLGTLAAALAAALLLAVLILLRFIAVTRKQKKTIREANENNALKAKFISNISAQLEPTLRRMDASQPEVKALADFAAHIQTLSELDSLAPSDIGREETAVSKLCEELMNQIRDKVRSGVRLTVNAPDLRANINREYVSHVLLHLLTNAAAYTPEGGHISLEFKRRSARKIQFLVANTGSTIPAEKREDVFKPFLEIHDLSTGDGLGLPICRQMALKMNGDLAIDPEFTKGTRFVMDLVAEA